MTLAELKTILDGTTYPVAYRALEREDIIQNRIKLPWIVYNNDGDATFSADNVVYASAHKITVELFEKQRDEQIEGVVETALTNAGIYFTKDFEYLDEEICYGVIYKFEV